MKRSLRIVWIGLALSAVAALTACSSPEWADDYAPPPPYEAAPPPPPEPPSFPVLPEGRVDNTELLGGPDQPLAPETPAYPDNYMAERPVISNRPVPNPEDMTPGQRAEIYPNYGRPRAGAAVTRRARRSAAAARRARAGRAPAAAAAPRAARPRPPVAQARPPAARVQPSAPASAPAAKSSASPAPRAAAPAPTPAPKPPAAPMTATAKLGAALNPTLVAGSKFDIPAAVGAGKPGVVTLTLPVGLSEALKAEARKLGLTRQASSADIAVTLTGAGYSILPNGEQTARLKAGEAVTFNWQVTPGTETAGPLKAQVSGVLKGGRRPEKFVIGDLVGQPPGPPADAAPAQGSKVGAAIKSALETAGRMGMGLVVLAAIFLLAIVLMIASAIRTNRDRKAVERRRRRRTYFDETPDHDGQASDRPHETV